MPRDNDDGPATMAGFGAAYAEDAGGPGCFVGSEVGALRKVLVHRPGSELLRLVPGSDKDVPLDDVPWAARCRQEHDAFSKALAERGVEVVYFDALLTSTMARDDLRLALLERTMAQANVGPQLRVPLLEWLASLVPAALTRRLVGGVTYGELPFRHEGLVSRLRRRSDFVLPPSPNQLFVRDSCALLYDRVMVNQLTKPARRLEATHVESVVRGHPLFASVESGWGEGYRAAAPIEGGDVLVVGDGCVLVGVSERTSAEAVELLAEGLFASETAREVIAVVLPRARSTVPLDTVLSMVDWDAFTVSRGLRDRLATYRLRPGPGGVVTQTEDDLFGALARALEVGEVRVIETGEPPGTGGEPWDSPSSVLAIAPGVVVTYDRSVESNRKLRAAGIEVVEVAGDELGRGRGGPRSLTCPLQRDSAPAGPGEEDRRRDERVVLPFHPMRSVGSARSRPGGDERVFVHDVIGIGFGPANLALATALEDTCGPEDAPVESLFFERQPASSWHPGMLLEGTTLQVSFLKDLATLRDPRSRFTFLSYLQAKGRLHEFVNLRSFFPSRIEFNDYLLWVADQLRHRVRYNMEVVDILPVRNTSSDPVDAFEVLVRDETGGIHRYRTRNVVVATGGTPRLPAGAAAEGSGRAFHSADLRLRLDADFADREAPYRFVVVGSGQSAAEAFQYLGARYRNADVTAVMRGWGYKPADESEFVNEIFFPEMRSLSYDSANGGRLVTDRHRDTNYSVVDAELITEIYRELYEASVSGEERARLLPLHEFRSLSEHACGVNITLRDLLHETSRTLDADAVVFATGYDRRRSLSLLRSLDPYLEVTESGGYVVERDYSIKTAANFRPRVFLQGFSEETHGLSETLLSLLAVRGGEIASTIVERLRRELPLATDVPPARRPHGVSRRATDRLSDAPASAQPHRAAAAVRAGRGS